MATYISAAPAPERVKCSQNAIRTPRSYKVRQPHSRNILLIEFYIFHILQWADGLILHLPCRPIGSTNIPKKPKQNIAINVQCTMLVGLFCVLFSSGPSAIVAFLLFCVTLAASFLLPTAVAFGRPPSPVCGRL